MVDEDGGSMASIDVEVVPSVSSDRSHDGRIRHNAASELSVDDIRVPLIGPNVMVRELRITSVV